MIRTTLVLLLLAALAPARAGAGEEDRDVMYYGFRATLNGHAADFPDDPSHAIPDGFARFCKAIADRGMTFVVLQVAYREGNKVKATAGADLLQAVGVDAAPQSTLRDKVLLAKSQKIKLMADLSDLAESALAGGPEDPLAKVDPNVLRHYLDRLKQEGFEGLYSDRLPTAWRPVIAGYTRDKRWWLEVAETAPPTETRIEAWWTTSDNTYRDLAWGCALNATALGYANPCLAGIRFKGEDGVGWSSPTLLRNALLFRAIATRPRGVLFSGPTGKLPPDFGVPPEEGAPKLLDLTSQIARQRERPPIFNIVTDLGPQDHGDASTDRGPGKFGQNLVALCMAAVAAGYEPRITERAMTEEGSEVAAYYLYMKGWEGDRAANDFYPSNQGRDLSQENLDLIRNGNTPIFVQVATVLPSANVTGSSNWMIMREYFGLGGKAFPPLKLDEIPEQGVLNGKWYKHGNTKWDLPGRPGETDPLGAKMMWMTGMAKDDMDPEVEVLALGYQAGNQTPLCTKRIYRGGKPNYFVNGSVLDLEAVFLLTNVLTEGHGMLEPAGYLYVMGRTYSAVLAMEDTTANFQLPGRTTFGYGWTQYDPDGKVTKGSDNYDPKSGITNLKLKAGALMVIEPKEVR